VCNEGYVGRFATRTFYLDAGDYPNFYEKLL
jgi:hypothetical protein